MGVIRRQGFKYSIISFIGIGIGVLSNLFIYPNALEVIGLYRALIDASVLATILVLLGSPTSAVRFFPRYQDEPSAHKGLLSWLLIVYAGGFLLFLLFFPWISQLMSEHLFDDRNQLYRDFINYVIPLTFCIGLSNLLARYISNFRRIVIPAAFENLTIKIILPILVFGYIKDYLTIESVVIGIVVSYILVTLAMTFYLYSLGQYRLTKPMILEDKKTLKEYSKYSWYGLLSGIGSQMAFRIDALMVSSMIQFTAGGLYAVSYAVSEVIAKPMRAIATISGPVIAQHIESGNLEEVRSIYRKSSLNLTIVGLGLFLLIWTGLPFIFEIMPNTEEMKQGAYVVFFLGLAQVWDMMTGINNEIIIYSKHYRFNLYLTLFLAVTNITLNLILIKLYGITGAAMATCISFFLFNVVKYIFIKIKFGFQPFSTKLIPVIAFGIGAWFISDWLPLSDNSWINLFYKGTVFSLLFGFSIWGFKISPDINSWIAMVLKKIVAYTDTTVQYFTKRNKS